MVQVSSTSLPLWVLVAGVLVFLLGVMVFISAVRVRRRGDAPYCRKCGYSHHGLKSDRCPECGREITSANTVLGDPCRRPKRLLAAIPLLLAGAVFAGFWTFVRIRHVNLYEYRPTAWVIGDLQSGPAPDPQRAWTELKRRMKTGTLSQKDRDLLAEAILKNVPHVSRGRLLFVADEYLTPRWIDGKLLPSQRERLIDWLATSLKSQDVSEATQALATLDRLIDSETLSPGERNTVIEAALVAQTTTKMPPRLTAPTIEHLLYRFWLAGQLTETQTTRYMTQGVRITLSARARVVLGDDVPLSIEEGTSLPISSSDYMYGVTTLDGQTLGDGGLPELFTCSEPGKHTVQTIVHVKIGERPTTWSHDFVAAAQFEVLPTTQSVIRTICDPELAPQIQACIKVSELGVDRTRYPPAIGPDIKVEPLPVAVGFAVFVRFDGQEHLVGIISGDARGGKWRPLFRLEPLPVPSAGKADVVLRSNEAVTRRTVDLYEMWEGELVYREVPFKGGYRPATQPAKGDR